MAAKSYGSLVTPEKEKLAVQLFEVAIEFEGDALAGYLANIADTEVKARVEDMLAGDYKDEEDSLAERVELATYVAHLPRGRFIDFRKLGSGGFGTVIFANDTYLERSVAIKFLSPRSGMNSELRERFRREAKVTAKLEHRNVVRVWDAQVDDDGLFPYIVSEFVDGQTLRGQLPLVEAVRIAKEIAEVLVESHAKGIMHRDLKPGNVMVMNDGRVKVLDFGIAKLIKGDGAVDLDAPTLFQTTEGKVLLTLPYASPEQLGKQKHDERSDLWSLGVVLFEMVSGIRPFSDGLSEQFYEINNGPPVLPSLTPPPPPKLVAILNQSLAPKIQDRYQSAAELKADLDQLLDLLQPAAQQPSRGESRIFGLPVEVELPFLHLEEQQEPNVALPAVALSQINEFKDMPFDLGTVWGLDRSSFIGVLAGSNGDVVYNSLQSVERLLNDELKTQTRLRLPTRWWMKVSATKLSNGPKALADISGSLIQDHELFLQLGDRFASGELIPGLFLELNTHERSHQMTTTLNWVRGLFALGTALSQVAVVIQVTGNSSDKAIQDAASLLAKLNDLNLGVSSELVVVREKPVYRKHQPEVPDDPLDRIGKPVGFHFSSWVAAAVINAGDEWGESQEQEFDGIVTALRQYRSSTPPDLRGSSARQVTGELEKIVTRLELPQVFKQFLLLVHRYLPEYISAMVKAFAKSEFPGVSKTSLVFATQSDTFVDAWVDGYFDGQKSPLSAEDFRPLQGRRPYIDDFVLGLLRRYIRGQNRDEIMNQIEGISRVLSPDILQICWLCFRRIGLKDALKSLRPKSLIYLLRAELNSAIDEIDLSKTSLQNAEIWWLHQGLEPSSNRLQKRLELNSQCRAVFGLASATEWQQLSKQRDLAQAVTICRRGRPLVFNSLSE